MKIGDPFVRHTAYCFQVLEGIRHEEFNEKGLWPSAEPADVDEPSQETLVGQLMRWKELVKKYASVSKMLDPREMFIMAVAVQRWPGPILEIGTHKGITTCLMSEVMNNLKRNDLLYTVELFQEGYLGPTGDEYPGDSYLKAIQQFRDQRALHRVVPIIGDSHRLKPLFFGVRPALIFLDGDTSYEGVLDDLQMLNYFNYHHICMIHNANIEGVMDAVQYLRGYGQHYFVNFHTGSSNDKGIVALARG